MLSDLGSMLVETLKLALATEGLSHARQLGNSLPAHLSFAHQFSEGGISFTTRQVSEDTCSSLDPLSIVPCRLPSTSLLDRCHHLLSDHGDPALASSDCNATIMACSSFSSYMNCIVLASNAHGGAFIPIRNSTKSIMRCPRLSFGYS